MRRLRAFCGTAALLLLGAAVRPATAEMERIHSYHSQIVVHADGSMQVTETITVTAAGVKIKRGIYRDFPTVYRGPLWTRVVVPFQITKVTRDGQPEPYHTEKQTGGVRVYVGHRDRQLKPGRYTYTIQYATDRCLGYFDEHDELYWNVTGNDWAFPIDQATAEVILPAGVPSDKIRHEGYTGPKGSKAKHLESSVDEQTGHVRFKTTRPLGSYEGLTTVVGFPKGFVREPTAAERWTAFWAQNRFLSVGAFGLLLVLGYYSVAWAKVGRDPARGTIIPRFEPPLDMAPACLRYVYRKRYDRKCFAAALINVAVKGFIRIKEKDGKYTLERTDARRAKRTVKAPLSPGEKRIAKRLAGSKRIKLGNSYSANIKKAVEDLKTFLELEYDGKMFRLNRKWLIPGIVLSVLTVLAAGLTGSGEQIAGFLFMCVWLTGWTVGVTFLSFLVVASWAAAIRGRKSVGEKAGSAGFALFITLFSIPFLAGEVAGFTFLVACTSVMVIPLLVALIGVNVLFFILLERRTDVGRKLMDQIEGFRMYLSTAEARYLDAVHPPDRTPELFEKMLPHAMALDVENQWSEQFADVLGQAAQGAEGGAYCPAWYDGHCWSPHDFGRSSGGVGGFASGLGSSLAGAIASSARAPGSRSGFSGGGGGWSGGGGGGGGGGW